MDIKSILISIYRASPDFIKKARIVTRIKKKFSEQLSAQTDVGLGQGDFSKCLFDFFRAFKLYPGNLERRPMLPNILVVSHEASWTGVPILAYNLAMAYSKRYNVTVMSMRGGSLIDNFAEVSTSVIVPKYPDGESNYYKKILDLIQGEQKFIFAVVNSIESRQVLKALKLSDIPSVTLFHEFASCILPRYAFIDAIYWSSHVVFSTYITLENALEMTGISRIPKISVFPQGKCVRPLNKLADQSSNGEKERVMASLRISDLGVQRFIVLGVGSVEFRKGVDLFIETASRVLNNSDCKNVDFVWFGSGYYPGHDTAYSIYLNDQINRSGLTDRVIILPETSQIDYVYSLADVFLLSSRLDPLPNVVIDSMLKGLPIICFDRATGVPDLLTQAGLREECVADFLDTAGMGSRLLELIRSPERLRRIAAATQSFAEKEFEFTDYANRIEALALSEVQAITERETDIEAVIKEKNFDAQYVLPPEFKDKSLERAAKFYVTENATSSHPRRPEPGFNPHLYWKHLIDQNSFCSDPYANFVKFGRPSGPWITPVIRSTDPAPDYVGSSKLRTALHIHAYYIDDLQRILGHLELNLIKPDLFVSVADAQGQNAAAKTLKNYGGHVVAIRIVPNRGRDIGPLLTEFGAEMVATYDVIGHVHTKKSILVDEEFVLNWTNFLFENMLGGCRGGPMLDRIVSAFAADEKLGLVFPSDPNIYTWSKNEFIAKDLVRQMGLSVFPEAFDFPVGTQFWMRSEALTPFVNLNLQWSDYPREPVPSDGTMLHVFERLFGLVPLHQGFNARVTNVAGLTR